MNLHVRGILWNQRRSSFVTCLGHLGDKTYRYCVDDCDMFGETEPEPPHEEKTHSTRQAIHIVEMVYSPPLNSLVFEFCPNRIIYMYIILEFV